MKKIVYKIGLISSVILFTACDSDLHGVNDNPNEPEKVPTYTLLNGAVKEFMDTTRDEWFSGRIALPWVQYWAQTAYTEESRYQFREGTNKGGYEDMYKVAENLRQIIAYNTDEATKVEMAVYGSNNNQIAAARILLAYVFQQLTDIYGPVAYYSYGSSDETFQGLDILNHNKPVYASQEAIYNDLLKELKEASAMIDVNEIVFSKGDNIYGGDPIKWKKFANSLRMRVAVRIGNTDEIASAIAEGVFESNADNASLSYMSSDTNASPMYKAFLVDNRSDFAVSNTFIDLLKGKSSVFSGMLDPRLFQYAAPKSVPMYYDKNKPKVASIEELNYEVSHDPNDYEGAPIAYENTDEVRDTEYSYASGYKVLRPDYTEVFMEYAEVAFIKSEYMGWDQGEYENGIRASMERWGVEASDIDAYMTSVPASNEENVLTQKYIALYMQPYEAWSEYRRTGFPNTLLLPNQSSTLPNGTAYTFDPLVDYLTDLPTRLPYPTDLQNLNPENWKEAVDKLGGVDRMDVKLLWDKN